MLVLLAPGGDFGSEAGGEVVDERVERVEDRTMSSCLVEWRHGESALVPVHARDSLDLG